jgi:hypothetical protein
MKLRTIVLILIGLCAFGDVAQAQQFKKPRAGATRQQAAIHPVIDPGTQQCSDCHAAESRQWAASKHGQSMVKCLICHGAVNANFIPKPAPDRCIACHASIVRDLNKGAPTAGKTCFQCHAPHSLDPHIHQTGEKQ